VRDGFALVDQLGSALSAKGGLAHNAAFSALACLRPIKAREERRIFKLANGTASVLEATAVAAGTVRATGRRVIAVADIGAGTSDFGAFMTGLPGRNVLAEIKGGSRILHEAGDYLDMQLRRHILNKAGLLHDDPAARGASNRLRAKARRNKEILFSEGKLTDKLVMISSR
jgi:molecular chaperone DnaK (HSP70)